MIKRLIILLSLIFLPTIAYADYTSQYPVAQNSTYVKATSAVSGDYNPYYCTDPTKSLTGDAPLNSWEADTPNRIHIDYGSGIIATRIYYENYHNSGATYSRGAKDFTFWGSNTASAFADTTYGTDTNWTQIGGTYTMDAHVVADQADPKYIAITNSTSYQYYALKISTDQGGGYIGLRRLVLQTGTAPYVYSHIILISRLIYRFINLVGLI